MRCMCKRFKTTKTNLLSWICFILWRRIAHKIPQNKARQTFTEMISFWCCWHKIRSNYDLTLYNEYDFAHSNHFDYRLVVVLLLFLLCLYKLFSMIVEVACWRCFVWQILSNYPYLSAYDVLILVDCYIIVEKLSCNKNSVFLLLTSSSTTKQKCIFESKNAKRHISLNL